MTSQYRHRRSSNPATIFPQLEPGEISVNTANRQLAVGDAASGVAGNPLPLLAVRFFDVRATYAIGDLVLNAGKGYRALVANGPGTFNPVQWELSSAQLIISATAPAGVPDGTLWWESDTGFLYVRYNDGNSVQWVIVGPQADVSQFVQRTGDTMSGPLIVPTPTAGGHATSKAYVDAGDLSQLNFTAQSLTAAQQSQARANISVTRKNYIINGAMMVSQEQGTNIGPGTPGFYPADMFQVAGNISVTAYAAQEQTGTPGGSPYQINLSSGQVYTPVAGDSLSIQHSIEGNRYVDLWQPAVKQITLRFGVNATRAGTYCVSFRNYGGTRSYVAEYTISAGEAGTSVIRTITLPATDGAAPFEFGTGAGLIINWSVICGTTYQTATPNTWVNGNYLATANQTNWSNVSGNRFTLFDVGLYEGTVAPPFQVPDFASELALCMRYWEKTYPYSVRPGTANNANNQAGELDYFNVVVSSYPLSTFRYSVPKRAVPSIILYSPYTGGSGAMRDTAKNADVSGFVQSVSESSATIVVNGVSTAAGSNIQVQVVLNARL